MKTRFASKTMIALAVAVAAAAGYKSLSNEQPMPPPVGASALPENIPPGSPVAQVVKLVQAGVDVGVIQTFISNCPTAFSLDADKIISLTDAGLPSDLVNAMFAHDKDFLASLATAELPVPTDPPAPPPPPATVSNSPPPAAPAPIAEVTPEYFYNTLTPYGAWVEVEGYGRCWRPNVMVYDANWRPYCDRGRWVYTDCGWYWDSDYSWGVTFHYGRWFNSPRHGWCWWPDNVWAPSWVTWRSATDYCGWAPLPPYTVYQPGFGFAYRGENVSVSFGFGLASSCFTFVSVGNFCQPQPRRHCVPPAQVTQIYNQTTIINNYGNHNHTIVNNGVSVTVIGQASRRHIEPVPVRSIGNASRHGWRSPDMNRSSRHGSNAADASDTRQLAGPGIHRNDASSPSSQNDRGHLADTSRRSHLDASSPVGNHPVKGDSARPSPTADKPSSPVKRRDSGFVRGNQNAPTSPGQNVTAPADNNKPAPVVTPRQNQTRNHDFAGRSVIPATTQPNTPSAVVKAPPTRTLTPNHTPSVNRQQPARSDARDQVRQVSPQPASPASVVTQTRPQRSEPRQNFVPATPRSFAPAPTSPPAIAAAPARSAPPNHGPSVASQRTQVRSVAPPPSSPAPSVATPRPQFGGSSQNFAQAAPRNVAPAMPAMSQPMPNQGAAPGASGNIHGWMSRNR